MRTWAFFAFILLAIAGRSQNTINSYKYVLVPYRYDFLKSDDQYGLNSTSRSLLEQKGFTVFFSNDNLPPSLAANKCAALVASVSERKAFFSTNLTITLKDCTGNIVWKSKEGASREKEFFVAYDHALRDAFVSLNATPYKYDSTLVAQSQAQPRQLATTSPATTTPATTAPATTPLATTAPAAAPPATATPAAATPATVTPTTTTLATATPAAVPGASTLYAQPIPNGFQVVDTSPKKILTLLKTSLPDYFLAQSTETNGIVFKKDGEWHFEYYKDDKLMSQKLDIKF